MEIQSEEREKSLLWVVSLLCGRHCGFSCINISTQKREKKQECLAYSQLLFQYFYRHHHHHHHHIQQLKTLDTDISSFHKNEKYSYNPHIKVGGGIVSNMKSYRTVFFLGTENWPLFLVFVYSDSSFKNSTSYSITKMRNN